MIEQWIKEFSHHFQSYKDQPSRVDVSTVSLFCKRTTAKQKLNLASECGGRFGNAFFSVQGPQVVTQGYLKQDLP